MSEGVTPRCAYWLVEPELPFERTHGFSGCIHALSWSKTV